MSIIEQDIGQIQKSEDIFEKPIKYKRHLPDSFIMLGITACAYWIAFQYENGYLSTFGVPRDLLRVNLQRFLIVTLSLSSLFLIVAGSITLLVMIKPKQKEFRFKYFRISCTSIIIVWYGVQYGFCNFFTAFAVFYLFLFEYFLPRVFQMKKPLTQVFHENEIKRNISEDASDKFISSILKNIGPVAYLLVTLFIFGSIFSYNAGKSSALKQKDFFTFADAKDSAIIRVYDDLFIAVDFNRITKTLNGRVVLKKITADEPAVKIIFEKNIGPLKNNKIPPQFY